MKKNMKDEDGRTDTMIIEYNIRENIAGQNRAKKRVENTRRAREYNIMSEKTRQDKRGEERIR